MSCFTSALTIAVDQPENILLDWCSELEPSK